MLFRSKLGLKCWNLGIGGASNDTAFRCASYWIPKLKPRYVCYMPTFANRLEIITPDKIERYLPSYEFYSSEDKKFYDKWLSMEENGKLNKEKNIRGIKSICDENAIPIIVEELDSVGFSSKARDMVHPGKDWNNTISNKILSKIS